MAGRPSKSIVDYFPHDTSQRKTLFILKSKYGNDGYAFWFQLLEILGHTAGHSFYCNCSENIEYLAAYTGIGWSKCLLIFETLASIGAIDKELWSERIIWSDNFVKRLEDVYSKRQTKIPAKPLRKPINSPEIGIFSPEIGIFSPENTQRKGREGKGRELKKSKLKKYFSSDSIEIGLVEFFIELLNKREYEWKRGEDDPQKWATEFDKIIRIDGRSPERIKEVLLWIQPGFWGGKILSPGNLRDKWGKITQDMKGRSINSPNCPGQITLKCYFCEHECQAYPGEHDLICAGCGAPYHKRLDDDSWTRNVPIASSDPRMDELENQVGKEGNNRK